MGRPPRIHSCSEPSPPGRKRRNFSPAGGAIRLENYMKYFAQLLVLAVPLGALATPLQKEQIGADAKWLLHLDADKLRGTKAR